MDFGGGEKAAAESAAGGGAAETTPPGAGTGAGDPAAGAFRPRLNHQPAPAARIKAATAPRITPGPTPRRAGSSVAFRGSGGGTIGATGAAGWGAAGPPA